MLATFTTCGVDKTVAIEAREGTSGGVRLALRDTPSTGAGLCVIIDTLEDAERLIAILQVETQRQRSAERAAMAMREAERAAA